METYKCNRCKIQKPFADFNKNKSRHTGYSQYCKQCISNRNKSVQKDHSKHYSKNSFYYKIKAVFRKKNVKQATPNWLTKQQKDDIKAIYQLAMDCSVVTGEQYHVDHIVPIKGTNVCGLHVSWNLQVLPSDLNLIKSNVF